MIVVEWDYFRVVPPYFIMDNEYLIEFNAGVFQEYEYTQDWIYETENRYKYDDNEDLTKENFYDDWC